MFTPQMITFFVEAKREDITIPQQRSIMMNNVPKPIYLKFKKN